MADRNAKTIKLLAKMTKEYDAAIDALYRKDSHTQGTVAWANCAARHDRHLNRARELYEAVKHSLSIGGGDD